jgi:FliI/YscN family ATPase
VIGRAGGEVIALEAQRVVAAVHGARAGDRACIVTRAARRVPAVVSAIDGARTLLVASADVDGVAPGDRVELDPFAAQTVLGAALLGRAVGPDGAALDGGAAPRSRRQGPGLDIAPPHERVALVEPFWTGVRAIDGPLTLGRGARIGIFGAAGAGKSTLLEAIVAGSRADATVVALIGERGREAERWLRRVGPRTTVVCATSDRSAGERLRAADLAFAHAAALRARGLHVLLVVDSLARVAAAARDVALAHGEAVGRAGFPPSVVARQARLLERAGATASGSVTLVATVLAEGALEHDPVAEAARAALDGHIVLSRRLADAGWFPAIDLPASASRTMADVAAPGHRRAARLLRAAVAALDGARDARALGLDPAAGDPQLARAIAAEPAIAAFLRQASGGAEPTETLMHMRRFADSLDDGYLQ